MSTSPAGDGSAATTLPQETRQVEVPVADIATIVGPQDRLLRQIEQALSCSVHVRGNVITLSGDPDEVAAGAELFEELGQLVSEGQPIDITTITQSLRVVRDDGDDRASDVLSGAVLTHRGRTIRPRTLGQKRYVDRIRQNTVVFGIGPAGTGKTYLAMAAAVQALRSRQVNRLVLTRPAVEAGERLGFLPGTMHEKIDPYLRPLWDALHDMMEAEEIVNHIDRGTIEVAPLAFMRGRSLNRSFIVLDEAQNTTPEQMKMFLTRIGFGSKAVVTGDISQVDLPSGTNSGLKVIRDILTGIEGVGFAYLDGADVVRDPIVQRIVEAYDQHDRQGGDE